MARENYLVFARKWRPQTFEDVVGQEHITRTLQNAIANNRIAHAFLFIGSRGIGKTTTARILAKALNCLSVDKPTTQPCNNCDNCRAIAEGNSMDVIEIDGASNNSVDDVREIREHVRLTPSRSRYKIYIIDEVHQLSAGAFNALLKTIEEPPPHALFILATTEAHKVPATIVSRCQRFDFRRVPIPEIVRLLRQILDKENIKYTDEALFAVARAAEGGVRDAESVLDQLVSYAEGEITFQHVFDVLGLVDWQVLHNLCDAILNKDIASELNIVEDVVASGKDLGQFVQEILRYFRNLLVCKTAPTELLGLPEEEIALMQAHAEKFSLTNVIRLVEQFADLTKGFDSQLAQRIALEALLIRISKRTVETSIDELIEKLMALSESGAAPSSTPTPRPGLGAKLAQNAAPVRQKPSKVEASPKNLGEVWQKIADTAEVDMSCRIGIDAANPAKIEGDTLILEFDPQKPQPREFLERPESKKAIESALATVTSNLTAFRCQLASQTAASQQPKHANGPNPALGESVSAQEAKAALNDPHVAKVVDVFKGKIVDIRKKNNHDE